MYMVRTIIIIVCLFLSVSLPEKADAQVRKEKTDSIVPGRDRWALRTNALEWLLTIPNIGFEYDLSNSIYNRLSVGINARFNWNTAHTYAPPLVFNVFELRPEFRYYWRQSKREKPLSEKPKFGEWMRERVFTSKRDNPKSWRAYYVGWYLNAGTYGFKFGKTGHQGQMIGTGISLGYGLPLYEYKKCAIDLELGLALGVAMTRYTAFAHNPDGNYYYPVPEKDHNTLSIVPYPVLSELKVAFVLRRLSLDDKYKAVNTAKITERMNKRDERKMDKETARQEKETAKQEKAAAREAGKKDNAEEVTDEAAVTEDVVIEEDSAAAEETAAGEDSAKSKKGKEKKRKSKAEKVKETKAEEKEAEQ